MCIVVPRQRRLPRTCSHSMSCDMVGKLRQGLGFRVIGLYRGHIIHIRGYIGIVETKMETTHGFL